MIIKHLRILTLALLFLVAFPSFAQTPNTLGQLNAITTAVPFVLIAPDARGGSMGDIGVASTPDANSMHWNAAKYAFIEKDLGVSISYSPWLHNLVPDINLAYLTGFKRIDENQVVAASLRYFNLGNIDFTDNNGWSIGTYKPNEFALDASYSRFFTKSLSGSVSARFIHSNLTQGQYVSGQATKPGNSIAADVSIYQQLPVSMDKAEGFFAWGVSISNIGAKISYSNENIRKDFIPTNLRIGPSFTVDMDEYNRISFEVDVNKLLVPTPPIYYSDSVDLNGNKVIESGMNPDVSVPLGMIQSFYDAPGGFKEEMREFSIGAGIEYWYDKQFALRGGYFYEDKTKGNRKYFTLGAGLRYNIFGLDFSYLIPVQTNNPLEKTLRFSLLLNFNNPSK